MTNALTLQVDSLRTTEDAHAVARWIFDEWSRHEAGTTWAACLADVVGSVGRTAGLPRYFVCRRAGVLAGCASLVASDLPTRPELGPWLANVYVVPDLRGQGIGTALVEHATRHARGLTSTLYLYTFDQVALYARLGWDVLARDRYVARPITIMSKRLGAE